MATKPRFSEKYGYKKVNTSIQIEVMDESLRTAIWNGIYKTFLEKPYHDRYISYDSDTGILLNLLWERFFKNPLDEYDPDYYFWTDYLKDYVLNNLWYEIYDLIEFSINSWRDKYSNLNKYISIFNDLLEQNASGYRIIEKVVTPITDEIEISEISKAIEDTIIEDTVRIQLVDSLEKLSDRNNPDFRGSIKDSISALESLFRIITKDSSIELSKALKFIEEKAGIELHKALKDAFIKLYAWTSDAEGIRHSLMDYPRLGFPEAKFMLVSCSAFINMIMA